MYCEYNSELYFKLCGIQAMWIQVGVTVSNTIISGRESINAGKFRNKK